MSFLFLLLGSFIAGTLDTVAGFGGGLLLLPILVLVVGTKDAVILSAVISLGWNSVRVVLMRNQIQWRAALLFGVGIVPGALLGGQFFSSVDPHTLKLGIAALLIFFGLYYVIRLYAELPHIRLKEWTIPITGLVSGIVASILGAGNGPFQTWGMDAAGYTVREVAVTNGVLGDMTALSRLGAYAIHGDLSSSLWLPGFLGVAAATAGALLGVRLSRRSNDSTLKLAVGIAIIFAGVRLLF